CGSRADSCRPLQPVIRTGASLPPAAWSCDYSESLQGGAAGGQGGAAEDAVGVGLFEEVGAAVSADAPVLVVQQQVAVPTQQDSVVDVGSAVVLVPVVDVVCFGPGGWPVAHQAARS